MRRAVAGKPRHGPGMADGTVRPWLRSAYLFSALLLPGCLAHERTGEGVDAGPGGRDVGPVFIDAGLDAALVPSADVGTCGIRAVDFACTDHGNGAVPAGAPFSLPVFLGDGVTCYCGETIACSASVSAGVVELATAQCSDLLCDGCFPVVSGTCAIPALDPGSYRVRVNGVDAMELVASNDVPGIGPVDVCETVADDHHCGLTWTPTLESIDSVCLPGGPPAGTPFALHVTASVACGAIPQCEVQRTASHLRVVLRTVPTGCDVDCGGPTFPLTAACAVPALEPGDYDLVTESGLSTTFTVVAGTTTRDETCVARATTGP